MHYNGPTLKMSDEPKQRNLLDRFLGIFTDVRGGEGKLALAMGLLILLIMASYYLIKPVRDALMLQAGGAEAKTYMNAVTAFLLFFLVQGYAKMVSRYERTRLITVVTLIFVACLVGFWVLSRLGVPYLGYIFYVWASIFNVMVIAQFWSYANDVYSNESGKRLFPIVGFGGMFGAYLGTVAAGRLVDYIGVFELLLLAAGLLGLCIVLTNMVSLKVWGRQQIRVTQSSLQDYLTNRKEKKEREKLAFHVLKDHKYILYIALLVLALNLVNSTGQYILDSLVEQDVQSQLDEAIAKAKDSNGSLFFGDREIGDPDDEAVQKEFTQSAMGSFFASFMLWVNLLGMGLQLFVVGRLVKLFGIRGGLLWLPIIALGTYAMVLVLPVLKFVRIGKTLENASDYSVNNNVRHMLFLPTSRDIKYKAKQVVDSFFQRVGDFGAAMVVAVGINVLGLGVRGFAVINIVVIIGWFFIVRGIVREHKEIEAGNRPELTGEAPEELAA